MYAIFKKEIKSFFTTPIGYLIVGLFLLLNGLFLWVFKGPYNMLDYGFADMSKFFQLVPWVFLLLIPAITMRSFAEERRTGTLELLYIKPVSFWAIVSGKFLGALVLVILAVIPTFLYVYAVSELGTSAGNIDLGLVVGSYFGMLFLIMSYLAIGLFISACTENQIVAFILSTAVCFILYFGFEAVATLSSGETSLFIQSLGMRAHFKDMANGVLDTRDLIYFLSLVGFFLYLTKVYLKQFKR